MEPQPAIRTGVTASAIAHLSILAVLILLSDVHPFRSVTAEAIAVDIVTPQQVTPDKPEPPLQFPAPTPDPSPAQKTAGTPPSAAPEPAPQAPQQQAPPQQAQQQQAAVSRPQQNRREPAAPPPATSGSSAPGYTPPQPDLTVRYNVMLGLPPELPVAVSGSGEKTGDGYDASASAITANISSSVIAEFRRHLKTCSKLPASVAPSDRVLVKLRVFMTQDGRLAADPAVGGGSANIKAIELLQSAIKALKSCQPYAMLPPERYGEWKALDLVFTPKDFGS